jgi:CDP-diacylglycerol--glycerol-3-phosphate 3-phosphatidyltransferase
MAMTFANKVTVVRILAVPFFIATILYYSTERDHFRFVALSIFLFAVISDFVDGYIARTRHQKTRAGTILDPLADKILLISAFICLYKIGVLFEVVRFPIWLVVAVISRDIILILGAMILQIIHGNFDVEPTNWGRAAIFFQILSVMGMLLQLDYAFSIYVWWITLFFTIISLIDYTRKGIKILNDGQKS